MSKKYGILGVGRQGKAAAYDVAKFGDAELIILADMNEKNIKAEKKALSKTFLGEIRTVALGSGFDGNGILNVMKDCDVCVNALPYMYGVEVAELAIKAGCDVCDLGCDTEIVKKQKQLFDLARENKVTIVPDCGLAPGTSTMLAMAVFNEIVEEQGSGPPESIRLFCGGLPESPEGLPLGYKIVYDAVGMANNYMQDANVLVNGKVMSVPSLTEVESVSFGDRTLEAFHTAGGASLLPELFRSSNVKNFAYKTLRYPGHQSHMLALKRLGMLNVSDPDVRDIWEGTIGPALTNDKVPDIVLLRATAKAKGREVTIDLFDEKQGRFSAMERTTGFAAGIIAEKLSKRENLPAGVYTPDEIISTDEYLERLLERGFSITKSVTYSM